MENVQVQFSDDKKWIYLAIKADKIIGNTEKGSEKVAQAFWEDIEGTNLKVNLLVLVKKDKKVKAKIVADEEAPAINSRSSSKEKASRKLNRLRKLKSFRAVNVKRLKQPKPPPKQNVKPLKHAPHARQKIKVKQQAAKRPIKSLVKIIARHVRLVWLSLIIPTLIFER